MIFLVNIFIPNERKKDFKTVLQSAYTPYTIERDYNKNHNSVLKDERTVRRKARNEKLLNKKATELTNLNLVLYNVKDIVFFY